MHQPVTPALAHPLGTKLRAFYAQCKPRVNSLIVFTAVIGMLLAATVMLVVPLPERERALLLVFGALPPAVLNYIFAERYHQEPEKVASIVLIGNVAALVFLPLARPISDAKVLTGRQKPLTEIAFLFAEIISLGGLFSDLEWGYVLAFAFFIVMMFIRPAGLFARRS